MYLADEKTRTDYFDGIHTILTIHNIEYQGRYGSSVLHNVCGLHEGWYTDGTIRFENDVNFLKGGLLCADAINTVSPTYARELMDPAYAHGLHEVLQNCSYKMFGVLNGIDTVRYDPNKDPALAKKYTAKRLAGKKACKARKYHTDVRYGNNSRFGCRKRAESYQ